MVQTNFTPFPVLETDRLLLRRPDLTDDMDILRLRSDEKINAFVSRPKGQTIEDARKFIRRINREIDDDVHIFWLLVMKDSQKVAGTLIFWNLEKNAGRGELGYSLMPEYEGMGLMQEALNRAFEYGVNEMKLKIVDAYTHQDNTRSLRLLERNGFTRNHELEKGKIGVNEPLTTVIYTTSFPSAMPAIPPFSLFH